MRLQHCVAAALLAVGVQLPCAAAEPADPVAAEAATSAWRFNGYGTLGVVHAEVSQPGWGFTRDMSQPAESGPWKAGVDSRLGLQLNWQATPTLEFVAQGVARRQDPDADALQRLDWAFVAWRPHADWTVRAGRTSPDVFLLADYRNVGFAFPWVRPNVEMYGFIAFQSLDGIDLAHAWQQGDVRWKAKASLGRNTTTQASGGSSPTGERQPGARFTNKDFLIATLAREQGGLTVKATYARSRTTLDNVEPLAPLIGGLQQLAATGVPGVAAEAAVLADAIDLAAFRAHYAALGLQYEHDRWQLTAELSRVGGGARDSNGLRGYVSAAYRLGDVTPFVMLGRARPERTPFGVPQAWAATLAPLVGPDAAAGAVQLGAAAAALANKSRFDQRSVSLGLRWDVGAQTALKLQFDRYRVAPGGSAAWPGSSGFEGGRADVVSATMDFVF